ncbi:MAG: MotA/TolQ/ExbB proton channel family protein [Candidatus Omnitrophica bacterium]|nr:MotA/TolQ/ExbB proton channel family protein [Candidatus Omnitrophota bacterium]
MFNLVLKGGWLMWPIVLCSIFSLAIIIDKFLYFVKAKVNSEDLFSSILSLIKRANFKEAIELCEEKQTPLTNTLKVALLNYDQPKELIKESVEEVSLYEIPKLEKNLNFLATIAHISPLLGLLGTVTGMIRCFYIIQEKTAAYGSVNPADLAGGIWEALLTTAFGLAVAIPSYIAYNYFVSRVNFSVLEMEKTATELVSVLTERKDSYEV